MSRHRLDAFFGLAPVAVPSDAGLTGRSEMFVFMVALIPSRLVLRGLPAANQLSQRFLKGKASIIPTANDLLIPGFAWNFSLRLHVCRPVVKSWDNAVFAIRTIKACPAATRLSFVVCRIWIRLGAGHVRVELPAVWQLGCGLTCCRTGGFGFVVSCMPSILIRRSLV